MAFQFPANDFDDAQKLLAVLGDFWSRFYADKTLVTSLVAAVGRLEAQAHADATDLLNCLSRFTVPLLHTDEWYPLRLKESERNQTTTDLAHYGDSETYNQSTDLLYGVPRTVNFHCWASPADLQDVALICNRIAAPSRTYVRGLDFDVDTTNKIIRFRENPFADDLVAKEISADEREAILWLYRAQFDWRTMARQYGYAVGLDAASLVSSAAYKRFVNAVYDALVEGSTRRATEETLAALCGAPLASAAGTVTAIFTDARSLWICDETRAYEFHAGATPLVAVGDEIRAGQALTDTLQLFDCNRGQVPAGLRALVLGPGFLANGYFGELVFENKEVDWVIAQDASGRTRLSFEIGGFPGDVSQFWDDVHANGIAAGATLAQLLDQRTDADSEPTALALPATVNPLEFLVSNVLRNNTAIAILKPATFGRDALGLAHADILRKIVPPQTALIIAVELEITGDTVTMDESMYTETLQSFLGQTTAETLDPAALVTESVRAIVSPGFVG